MNSSNAQACNCGQMCTEISYSTQVTSSQWPSDRNWARLAKDFGIEPQNSTGNDALDTVLWKERTMNSLAKVDVFFRTKNEQILRQVPKYSSVLDFASTLGGSMSVFMGISIILSVEVIEMTWILLRGCCKSKSSRSEQIDPMK